MIPMFSMESAVNPTGDTDVMMAVVLSLIGLCLEYRVYGKLYSLTMSWLQKWTGGRLGQNTYPPNLTQVVVGMVWGGILTLFGLAVLIPIFGWFGIFWTLVGVIFTALPAWQFFVKKYPVSERNPNNVNRQLDQLKSLRAAGLMDDREYWEKRKQILKEL